MTTARLSRLEIQGFRSFGQSSQSFDLPETVAVFWGGNSQGKTSLAEAIEFLLSGQIVRRELLASAKDEFAGALRNAHVGNHYPTRVEADVLCKDGMVRKLTRVLVEDYRRGSAAGCASDLKIDGVTATQKDIQAVLGVRLSHPPLIAPVLTQHTLSYIFSAPPTERSTYFRALLDTQDLEDLRVAVSRLSDAIPAPKHEYLDKLLAAEKVPAVKEAFVQLRKSKTEADVEKTLLLSLKALLGSIERDYTGELSVDAATLDDELQTRRSRTFHLELLRRGTPLPLPPLTDGERADVDSFIGERAQVEEEAKRLVALFSAAIQIHDHFDGDLVNCPLCGTAKAISPERMTFIREQVQAAAGYNDAAERFDKVIRGLEARARASLAALRKALPSFLSLTAKERTDSGFSVRRIRDLVGDDVIVDAWLLKLRDVAVTAFALAGRYRAIIAKCAPALEEPDTWSERDALVSQLLQSSELEVDLAKLGPDYLAAAAAMFEPLKSAVDQSNATDGWEALLDCAKAKGSVFTAVSLATHHDVVLKSIQTAHDEIEKGNGRVADDKFSELSDDLRVWWERLRPDEPTYFDGVKRRSAKARRTVDVRVGLSAKEDRSDAKFRDAVAVLSQSQLHCLGLSIFLARAVSEAAGFVVLDDPVLSSDEDYRPNFASSVIEGLLAEGIQVIVATQDHATWKDIGHRWQHRNAALLQIVRNDPLAGTEIRNQNDDLATMIARVHPFTKSQDPQQRKEGATLLRVAIERFGKVLLVKNRKAGGDNQASITDYDGQNFGTYSAAVQALLTQDASHPGKIAAAHNYMTPGPHDDAPPSVGELKTALGDLKRLKKDYLD